MRGKQAPKRDLQLDATYKSEVVTKLINYIMLDGKKTVARSIVYQAMEDLGEKTKSEPMSALLQAIENVKPRVEVRSRRVGGANYQVPTPVKGDRQIALSFRWLINAARSHRGSLEFWQSLSRQLVDAFNNQGDAVKKKEEVERMADANKAFAQFAIT